MAFVSKNEINQFDFSDCKIIEVKYSQGQLVMKLESLIVLENNTQNANYTKSYADTVEMVLSDCAIESVILAGYKVYDANDILVEEVQDKVFEADKYSEIIEKTKDAYLYRFIKVSDDEGYVYDFEVEQSEPGEIMDLRNDTYVFRVKFSDSVFTWDRYLNRVQN